MKRPLLFILSALLLLPVARADEPVLRIETGHHTEAIRRISVDASRRWLLTASEDRTARLWSLATGKLARTFRAPIGTGDDGMIYAAALSPNGKTVVLSAFEETGTLYVVDRATGRVLKRIAPLPAVGLGVFFSPDGKRLAVTLRSNGVLVYGTAAWTVLSSDATYQGATVSADFDRSGRLVTIAEDGLVRLYGADGKPIASITPTAGRSPQSVRFSPSGDRVAVGFADGPRVALLSGTDLTPLDEPDTHDLPPGSDLHAVAWTGPASLVAAGTAPIVRWWALDGSKVVANALRPGPAVILDMAALADGSLVYGASDGSWGVLAKNGTLRRHDVPVTLSFAGERLKILPDARSVRFAYEPPTRRLGVFSATALKLTPGAEPEGDWTPPSVTDEHFEVTDWHDSTRPRIDGKRIEGVNPDEIMRAVAIGRGGVFFVLGSDWHLFAFERTGRKLWEGVVPGAVEAVNIGDGNRIVVAGYADGTIRWHRAADGALLLTLFPLSDRKRWVAWTPAGDYATSPGAEPLVKFVLNQGPDKLPEALPASRFAARFHRPDLVQLALDPAALTVGKSQTASEPGTP